MANRMSTLRISHVSKFFDRSSDKALIIDDATYTFTHEGSVAIMGVSGTGKSTLIHMLAGLDAPSSGSVFFDDADVYKLGKERRQDILSNGLGLIFQSPHLIDELSVVENVMIKGLIKGKPYQEIFKQACELLECVGLGDKIYAVPRVLSGGEQQRVAIARALLTKPSFIIADEPTAHLDGITKKSIMQLLLSCRRQWSTGLIIATHDDFVAQHMDVVLRLEKGKLCKVSTVMHDHSELVDQASL